MRQKVVSVGSAVMGRGAAWTAVDMTASIACSTWQPAVPAVIAAVVLACAGSAGADASAPTPGPLWKAYPLDTGRSTSTTRLQTQPAITKPTPSIRLDSRHQVTPLGILILFYAALGGMVLCLAGLARQHVRRRRAGNRSAPPPTGALRG
jgi:hypothetical protein